MLDQKIPFLNILEVTTTCLGIAKTQARRPGHHCGPRLPRQGIGTWTMHNNANNASWSKIIMIIDYNDVWYIYIYIIIHIYIYMIIYIYINIHISFPIYVPLGPTNIIPASSHRPGADFLGSQRQGLLGYRWGAPSEHGATPEVKNESIYCKSIIPRWSMVLVYLPTFTL